MSCLFHKYMKESIKQVVESSYNLSFTVYENPTCFVFFFRDPFIRFKLSFGVPNHGLKKALCTPTNHNFTLLTSCCLNLLLLIMFKP